LKVASCYFGANLRDCFKLFFKISGDNSFANLGGYIKLFLIAKWAILITIRGVTLVYVIAYMGRGYFELFSEWQYGISG
jgi:hypothetical protein